MEKHHPLEKIAADFGNEENGNALEEIKGQIQKLQQSFNDGGEEDYSLDGEGDTIADGNAGAANEDEEGSVVEYNTNGKSYNSEENIMAIINAELGEICEFLKERFYHKQA